MSKTHSNDPSKPASIMIVDDIARNIQVLASVLDKAGYRVAAAANGRQALAMIEPLSPDLVLLDIMMPEIDGFEVCRRIKASAAISHIPVILLTARTDAEDVLTGFRAGAVDYITKPFNTKELLARVRTHVLLKKARDTNGQLIADLQEALAHVRTLSGLIPVCPDCKKVRTDKGFWQQVEDFVSTQCNAAFSHGICPECLIKHYPEYASIICSTKKNTKMP
jgi:PleD family two-component response regulator